jgi:hypothetical protein
MRCYNLIVVLKYEGREIKKRWNTRKNCVLYIMHAEFWSSYFESCFYAEYKEGNVSQIHVSVNGCRVLALADASQEATGQWWIYTCGVASYSPSIVSCNMLLCAITLQPNENAILQSIFIPTKDASYPASTEFQKLTCSLPAVGWNSFITWR